MEIFNQSHLSKGRTIVEEIKESTRGRLFEVVEEESSKCKNKKCRDYALRIFDTRTGYESHGFNPYLLRSTEILTLHHPNLIKTFDVDFVFSCHNLQKDQCQEAHFLILSELASGSMKDLMQKGLNNDPSPVPLVKIINDILQGIAFLHRHEYVHRRLYPNNILMVESTRAERKSSKKKQHTRSKHYTAKLGDFYDLTVYFPNNRYEKLFPTFEQIPYVAPELLVGHEVYEPSADMWSFGILVYELVFGQGNTPFLDLHNETNIFFANNEKNRSLTTLKNIYNWLGIPSLEWRKEYMNSQDIDYPPIVGTSIKDRLEANKKFGSTTKMNNDKITEAIIDLIDQCLKMDPKDRLTAAEALNHRLFRLFDIRVIQGSVEKMPRVPGVPVGHFKEIRREIVRTIARDVEQGFMGYYPTLLALNIFDRSIHLFQQDIFENSGDGKVHRDLVYNLFCTSYLIASKLTIPFGDMDLHRGRKWKMVDFLSVVKGLICGETEKNRLTIIFNERIIVSGLHFKFYPDQIVKDTNINVDVFKYLENHAMDPDKVYRRKH